jgi:hypothetical protein
MSMPRDGKARPPAARAHPFALERRASKPSIYIGRKVRARAAENWSRRAVVAWRTPSKSWNGNERNPIIGRTPTGADATD